MSNINNYKWCQEILRFNITDQFLKLVAEKYNDDIPWETIVNDEKSLIKYIQDVKLPELRKKVDYNDELNIPKTSFFVSWDTLDPLELQDQIEYAREDDRIEWNLHLYDYRIYGNKEIKYPWEKYTKEDWERDCLELAANEMSKFINRHKSKAFLTWINQLGEHFQDNPVFQFLISTSLFNHFGYGMIELIPPPNMNLLNEIRDQIANRLFSPNIDLAQEYIERNNL